MIASRFFTAVAGMLLVCSATVCAVDPTTFDALQGSVHRANLQRTGVHTTKGLAKPKSLRWKFQTGAPVRSSPVAVGGTLFVGSNDGSVYALDSSTGVLRWKFGTGGKVTSSAAVSQGTVYIASEAGFLFALDAKTGEEKWSYATQDATAISPAPIQGIVLIGIGNKGGAGELCMTAKPVVALDATTGKQLWKSPSNGPQCIAAIATDGTAFYAGINGSSYGAFSLEDVRTLWQYSAGHQARQFASMTIFQKRVYIPAAIRGAIACVDASKGQKIWQRATLPHNETHEMNAEGIYGYEILTDLAVTKDLVLAGCNDGKLHAFKTASGERAWTFQTGGRVRSSPSVAGVLAYFGSEDGCLYAVHLSSGKLAWKQSLGAPINNSPWPGNGVIYAGCDDGAVYAWE